MLALLLVRYYLYNRYYDIVSYGLYCLELSVLAAIMIEIVGRMQDIMDTG